MVHCPNCDSRNVDCVHDGYECRDCEMLFDDTYFEMADDYARDKRIAEILGVDIDTVIAVLPDDSIVPAEAYQAAIEQERRERALVTLEQKRQRLIDIDWMLCAHEPHPANTPNYYNLSEQARRKRWYVRPVNIPERYEVTLYDTEEQALDSLPTARSTGRKPRGSGGSGGGEA